MKNPGLERKRLLDLYYYMRLNRSLEERLVNLYRQGRIAGGLYRSLGQEATAVGSAYALDSGDLLGPLIRDLGSVLVRGYTARECFAQYLARATSPTLGRDCVLHMGEVGGRGVIGAICMLGDLISVLAGCGLAFRMTGRDRVCLTYVGDGGTSTGGFHEGLNFAAVRKLPLIVIIENNGYAYSTPVTRQTAQPDFSRRGAAYGVPGESVDGNDVLAVYEATRRGVERARSGAGPTLIESRTFRMEGHAEHDDGFYVPHELVEEWRKRDPIERYEKWLLSEGVLADREIRAIGAGIEAQLDEDMRWAEQCPPPDPESALPGVYADDSPFRPQKYQY
jgi:TPP-dependent pyruvate/acetoin dehydrogenase alpha subunit